MMACSRSFVSVLPTASAGLEYEFIGKAVAADAQNWIFKSASATNFYLGGSSFADIDAWVSTPFATDHVPPLRVQPVMAVAS